MLLLDRRVNIDQFIDILLANPFFIIILIGGIYSLLKGKPDEEEQEKQQEQRRPRQHGSQQTRSRSEEIKPSTQQAKQEQIQKRIKKQQANEQAVQSTSIAEQRQKQMEQFAAQLDVEEENEHTGLKKKSKLADVKRSEEVQRLASENAKQQFKKDFNNSLTSKGLVNSVIMSEVLGAPRSRNPYESVIEKRMKS